MPRNVSRVAELRILSNVAELRSSGFLMLISNDADALISRSLCCVLGTSKEAEFLISLSRMVRGGSKVFEVSRIIFKVLEVSRVVLKLLEASRSGSEVSNGSIVVFLGASGLLHGVGDPLRLPPSAPPASDELEEADPSSNSLYSVGKRERERGGYEQDVKIRIESMQ